MATNLLWFVMAGFLLGFATSTLWEWFYFRKERLKLTDRRIRELEAKLRDADADIDSNRSTLAGSKSPDPDATPGSRESTRTRAWGDTAYRSPGVFLESEEFEEDDEDFGAEHAALEDRATSTTTPPTNLPVIPTVDSIVPKSTSSQSASQPSSSPTAQSTSQSTSLSASEPSTKSATQPTQPAAVNQPTVSEIPRVVEFASPADALRAKRGTGPRSRQEVLAALRRNSEAVQRGESPGPIAPEPDDEADAEYADEPLADASRESSSEVSSDAAQPSKARPSTLVSPDAPSEPTQEDTTPQQSPARQRWANDPKLTARSEEYPDDLSKIKGIGDVYKQRLYRAGIYTWKQIVEADSETLRRATSAYPSSNVEEWVTQAEKLMEKHGRKQAVYSGPQPDDMTKILGIGPVSAAALYRAGVCTYEQLASLPIAELEALFPIAVAGDMPDFEQWVARAANLADEKHS